MRLIKGNVERVAETDGKIAKLKALGFMENTTKPQPEKENKHTDFALMTVDELKTYAKECGITGAGSLKKDELVALLKDVKVDD